MGFVDADGGLAAIVEADDFHGQAKLREHAAQLIDGELYCQHQPFALDL